MVKCKLKPWKLNEPQVVYVSDHYCRRVVVKFLEKDCRKVTIEIKQHGKWIEYEEDKAWEQIIKGEEVELGVGMDITWREDFIDLLGVPKFIEDATNENL